jgi:neutral ceramidase
MTRSLIAGAGARDITPGDSQFLFGYPHVRRYSTGVHDPLLSSALFLSDGGERLLLSANDVIFVGRASVERVRRRIERHTGIPGANIMVAATHTHSGPITVDMLSNEQDPAVPKADPRYVEHLENGIVEAAVEAWHAARPAEIGLAMADATGIGTNRHAVDGRSNLQTPVWAMRDIADRKFLAAMWVCSMHPTVLHEDSTLVSGDFPAFARRWLQQHVVGDDCPVLHFTGSCGDQSPRHVTRANTFDEARRLGEILGRAAAQAIAAVEYMADVAIGCIRAAVNLPLRRQMAPSEAQAALDRARQRLESLRRSGASRAEVRTAECDWFGAEEALALSHAAADGRLAQLADTLLPAELMVGRIGPWSLAGWPGEAFVEFSLRVRQRCPNGFVISLANGELQGYLATEQAVRERWYEAMNSLFSSPEAGLLLADKTLELLERPATA